jgi:hypothetical protein
MAEIVYIITKLSAKPLEYLELIDYAIQKYQNLLDGLVADIGREIAKFEASLVDV